MKKYLIVLFFVVISAYKFGVLSGLNSAQTVVGSGVAKRVVVDVDVFDSLAIDGMGTVLLTHGPGQQLEIEADDNILAHIVSTTADSTLNIVSSGTVLKPQTPITYYVTYTALKSIELDGSVELKADTQLRAPELTLKTAGAIRMTLDLIVDILKVNCAGTGKLNLQGTAKNQTVSLFGACGYYAGKLASEYATINASGSVRATLNVNQTIKGEISGAAIVSYIGSPVVSVFSQGASSIRKVG